MKLSDTMIVSDLPLSAAERRTLAAIADLMIPADAGYGVPGAGDEVIQRDLLSIIRREHKTVKDALGALENLCPDQKTCFADLNLLDQQAVAEQFRQDFGDLAEVLVSLTLQVYYRDDRVVTSLGMEPRPPHPLGFAVEQGDWSLLDPVRRRAPFYRDPTEG